MNKVISINLGGKSYELEETGYSALKNYLDQASEKLAGNPDKDEIITDLEQAIAEKCNNYLNIHKNVITIKEVEEIIKEMGPIDGQETASEKSESKETAHHPRKFYRIKEGSIISGVCNGLAAYFDVDVTLIRIAFIILTILTGGIWVVAYIVMSFIIPQANTPEEMAQATGASKITAQELIDNARKSYHEFKDKEEWKQWRRNMKEQAKQWKYQWKKEAKIQKYNYKYNQCDHNYYHHRCHKKGLLHSIWDLFWMLVLVYAVWYGYHNFASVHQFLDAIVALYNRGIDWLAVNVH